MIAEPMDLEPIRERYAAAMNANANGRGVTAEIAALRRSVADVATLILRVAALEEELVTAYASATRARDRAESAERSLRIIATFIEQNTINDSDVRTIKVEAFNGDGERVA